MKQAKKKSLSCTAAYNALWTSEHYRKKKLEPQEIKKVSSVARQINGRVEKEQRPAIIIIQRKQNYP